MRTLEDVDVALLGVPFDTGVTYRVGGRFGPGAVRDASVMLRPYNPNLENAPFEHLSCVDYGDVAIVPGYIERSYAAIESAVAPIVEAGVIPQQTGPILGRIGPAATAAAIRERVGDRPAFISFDIDVVDPAFAPGTGTPEPGGLSAHDALATVCGLIGIDFVGFDVVEVIPAYDPADQTAFLAANLAYEMLSLVALRRLATSSGDGA